MHILALQEYDWGGSSAEVERLEVI